MKEMERKEEKRLREQDEEKLGQVKIIKIRQLKGVEYLTWISKHLISYLVHSPILPSTHLQENILTGGRTGIYGRTLS